MNRTLEKITSKYPIGCKIIYCNAGRKGHGNIAEVFSYLHRHTDPDRITYIELRFESSTNHVVTVNQLSKYYQKISAE
jgi:hypothetical protein